jgi:hypothetical protein
MKRSIRLAAKAHRVALVFGLIAAAFWIVAAIVEACCLTQSPPALSAVAGILLGVSVFSVLVLLACGFHIAIEDAVGRIAARDKSGRDDEII